MNGITHHVSKRMRKRQGIPKKSVEAIIGKVLMEGRGVNEFKGAFKKYLDRWCIEYKCVAIIYNNDIYFMKNGDTLTTTWPVPSKYRKYLK